MAKILRTPYDILTGLMRPPSDPPVVVSIAYGVDNQRIAPRSTEALVAVKYHTKPISIMRNALKIRSLHTNANYLHFASVPGYAF